MKQGNKAGDQHVRKALAITGFALALGLASVASGEENRQNSHKVSNTIHNNHSPVMMLSLPGRGALLSAPGEIATITIESRNGKTCSTYLARTDTAGVLDVPVASTKHCISPRIVIYR